MFPVLYPYNSYKSYVSIQTFHFPFHLSLNPIFARHINEDKVCYITMVIEALIGFV